MDRRSKHFSSEERGVIFAEHERGNSQQGIGWLLGCPAITMQPREGASCQASVALHVTHLRFYGASQPEHFFELWC